MSLRVRTGKHPNGSWCEYAQDNAVAVAWYQCSAYSWEIHLLEGRRTRLVGHAPSRNAAVRIAQALLIGRAAA